MQPGACSARYWLISAQQSWPIRKQNHRKGINFYRCFDLLLHASCKKSCQNNAIESHKSVISVIKIRGNATFDINAHFCWGLMWDSVIMHWNEAKQKSVKEIRSFHNLMQGAPWLMRFNFQGVHPVCFQTFKTQGAPWVVLHSGCIQNSAAQPSGCILVSVVLHLGCISHSVVQTLGCTQVSEA